MGIDIISCSDYASGKPEGQLMEIVSQHPQHQRCSRNIQQIPFSVQKAVLGRSNIQHRKKHEQRDKDHRHIVQVPRIPLSKVPQRCKPVFDGAKRHPEHNERSHADQISSDFQPENPDLDLPGPDTHGCNKKSKDNDVARNALNRMPFKKHAGTSSQNDQAHADQIDISCPSAGVHARSSRLFWINISLCRH